MTRERPRLLKHLGEQRELLARLGGGYDDGLSVLALPLAVTIRTLVHNTAASASLLTQLGEQERPRYHDTSIHIDPANLMDTWGVVLVQGTVERGAAWVPPLGDLSPSRMRAPVPFFDWWTPPILKTREGKTWSRKDLVLFLANKEGGAHVDPAAPNEALRVLEEENTLGWTWSDPIVGDSTAMLNGPTLPSIRQIAWELQRSIEPLTNTV